ncbi:MAG: hypothetical protein KC466_15885 [Myxococcales bacterium]|nr:hypothetical protein [Myxococcales bacterium]
MEILVAAFIEGREFRQSAPNSTRIDIFGAHWSAPAADLPTQMQPHLFIVYRADMDDPATTPLTVAFFKGDEQVARQRMPLKLDRGMLGERLVQAQLEVKEYGEYRVEIELPPAAKKTLYYKFVPAG